MPLPWSLVKLLNGIDPSIDPWRVLLLTKQRDFKLVFSTSLNLEDQLVVLPNQLVWLHFFYEITSSFHTQYFSLQANLSNNF